jgi:hypothetical protein
MSDYDAKCVCGRDIFRAWIEGDLRPWKHWVEPLDHPAQPVGQRGRRKKETNRD